MDPSIDKRFDKLEAKVDLCLQEIAGLKVKAGIWGALAALPPVLVGLVMSYLALVK